MSSPQRQRGEGKGGCIVGLLIFAAVVLFAYKLIPVKMRASELRETITMQARSAGSTSNVKIRKNIMEKARELKLPLDEKNLVVRRYGTNIEINAEYSVPVEFPGYTFNWSFKHHTENPVF